MLIERLRPIMAYACQLEGSRSLQEPAERPYGIEALFRDDSGNWFSLTQPKWLG